MSYFYYKIAHLVGMALFFGAGAGTAFLKLNADRSKDPKVIAFAMRHVVLADWLFTVPSGLIMPFTGLMMTGWTWEQEWIQWGLGLYIVAGAFWLPAAFMQIKMRRLADEAVAQNTPMPEAYWRLTRWWAALGAPAFVAAALTIYIMVTKRTPF